MATTPPVARVESSVEEQTRAAVEIQLKMDSNTGVSNIQRVYRGHRERRQLKGHGLTPSQRWDEALKEAHYRQVARPVSREARASAQNLVEQSDRNPNGYEKRRVSESKEKWDRAVLFAKKAQHDDELSSCSSSDSSGSEGDSLRRKERREQKRQKRLQKRKERIEYSKAMDMQYFLEMVDLKHRYGSNLRAYHTYWQTQPTHENFFYWLDYGLGKNIDLSVCPRDQLEKERVRYLSREERQAYLVKIDKEGRLCWAKNGERIDTSTKYHDSKNGIIPLEENPTPSIHGRCHIHHAHSGARARSSTVSSTSSSSSSSSSSSDSGQSERADRYVDPAMQDRHGPKQVFHVSASTVLNRLLRKTTKKNTWIFVADNSFRLYVGIKQSGEFQHSSFLHGARVSAAGLIRVKDGKLKSLSPLSGHYRPPATNFRKFVKSLKEAGVDMSHVSISKSYAILVGLEAYGNLRKGKKKSKRAMRETADKVLPKTMTHHDERKGKAIKDGVCDTTTDARRGGPDKALEKPAEGGNKEDNGFASRVMKKLRAKPCVPEMAGAVAVEGELGE